MQATTLTRRQAVKGAAGGLLGATLAVPRRSRARQADVTLRWWDYYAEGANATAMQNQLQRYMDANPNVTIERTAIPFADLKQKLLQGAAAGELPDIAVIDNPDHQAFAALGILEDLTERVTAWGEADAYFAGPWDSTIWEGRNYGIPDNSNCLVLWYNTAFTDPAEVAPPTNWTELREAAAALTEGDRMGLAVCAIKSEEGTFQWLPFLWETGEDIPTIDSEGGQRALQLWVDLVNEGHMSKGILGWTQQDVRIQFQNGKAAMMINGPWQIPVLKEESPDLEWEVATLPEERRKLVTSHDTFGYFADAYGFAVLGTGFGSLSTEVGDPSARDIAMLIEAIQDAGVPAIFAENVANPDLMESIAAEAGVVLAPPLYTDALGPEGSPGETYVGMMQSNVTTIVGALRG